MGNRISSLLTRARRHYSDYGIRGLAWNSVLLVTNRFVRHRSLSREELQNIAAERDAIWYAGEEEPIEIAPPSHVELQEAFKRYPKRYTPERPFVCEIEDCYLLGQNGVCMSSDNRIITETVDEISFLHLGSPFQIFKKLVKPSMKSTDDYWAKRIFPLISPDSSYYHWITEYLPKLRRLEYYEKQTGCKPTIIIEPDPREFVRDTLALAGYGGNRYREWDGHEKQVRYLVVPSNRPHAFDYQNPSLSNYNPSHSDFNWLRDRMRKNIDSGMASGSESTKLYISRQMASAERGRKVVNYRQVIGELHDRGFRSYILEDIPFRKQVKLFAEADVIMGPHGAGLSNMVFADDPLIIEMFPNDTLRPHFYFLSSTMDFEYEGIVTEAHDGNLVVDIGSLRRRLDEMGV